VDVDAKQPVRVTIFNQNYSLLAAGDPAELIDAANTVDELMSSIAGKSPTADSTRIAVLACLHLADRLRRAEDDLASLKEKAESLVGTCLSLMPERGS
jgi:cell division protein ZapA